MNDSNPKDITIEKHHVTLTYALAFTVILACILGAWKASSFTSSVVNGMADITNRMENTRIRFEETSSNQFYQLTVKTWTVRDQTEFDYQALQHGYSNLPQVSAVLRESRKGGNPP